MSTGSGFAALHVRAAIIGPAADSTSLYSVFPGDGVRRGTMRHRHTEVEVMKMCTRLASRSAGVMAAGAVVVLMSATTARAQQSEPFKSVNFTTPTAAASDSSATAGEPQGAAAPGDPGYVTFFKSTELGGLADIYYLYNSTKQPSLYRAFDISHNAFTLSMAQIWLNKAATMDSQVGFRVKLNFGQAPRLMNFNEPNTDTLNVEEGFVSYMAKVGKGLTIDVGKFVTNAGAEVIEAKDNWNYSRSLLFQNAIPLYHAGVRANYAINDQWNVMFGVVNGWNNVSDSNTGKSIMLSGTYKPNMKLSLIENYIGGPEKTGTNEGWRHMSDTVVSYTVNDKMSVLGNFDYTAEKPLLGDSLHLWGIAGYFKYQATPVFAVVPRIEYLDDKAGSLIGTGVVQKLTDFTLTLEMKPVATDNFLFRLEYRGDFSDQEAFVDDTGAPKKSQNSIIFGMLYSFSTK
jgi:hypothetical protein